MGVLRGVARLVGQYRPLWFFGLPGVLLLIAGVAYGGRVVSRFNIYGQLAVGTAMICVLLSIMGAVSLSTGVILHSVRELLTDHLRAREGGK